MKYSSIGLNCWISSHSISLFLQWSRLLHLPLNQHKSKANLYNVDARGSHCADHVDIWSGGGAVPLQGLAISPWHGKAKRWGWGQKVHPAQFQAKVELNIALKNKTEKKHTGKSFVTFDWVSKDFTNGAYPGGSGVKAKLLCDGEFSGVNICGYSSVHVLESPLRRQKDRLTEVTANVQQNAAVLSKSLAKEDVKRKRVHARKKHRDRENDIRPLLRAGNCNALLSFWFPVLWIPLR